MKSILITGGAGFIGCHLTQKLLEEGNYVICIDDFTLGNEQNMVSFINDKNFKFIKEDVTNVDIILKKLEKRIKMPQP